MTRNRYGTVTAHVTGRVTALLRKSLRPVPYPSPKTHPPSQEQPRTSNREKQGGRA